METASPHRTTVAFYNLENLFDTINDPDTLDDDFTPEGRKKWNEKRYRKKLKKLGAAIAQIGHEETGNSPSLVGIAEVENFTVVNDLVQTKQLRDHQYGIVHFDSPDERGIDVAMLYKKTDFELLSSDHFPVQLHDDNGNRDFTRDILLVSGRLKGELIYCLVNHWPSRRSGTEETAHKRIKAAQRAQEIVEQIRSDDENAKILIMGDFNDNPTDTSIKQFLVDENFYNPYESLFDKGFGTASRDKEWYLFDQIIISRSFFNESKPLVYRRAEIFDDRFLKSWKGKRKGSPFRTYIGKWHQGGYSDHFPVYILLETQQ